MRERTNELPLPPEFAQAHSERLQARIRDAIAEAGGWISFERYMAMALYEPGLGYYSAGAAKFGPAGDYVTAPELSPRFGRCLARQCAEVLEQVSDGVILEFGAGTGALAATMVETLADRGMTPAYWILEPSAELRARQQARLAALPAGTRERVHWLDSLPEEPFNGVVVANEVLDAMPVQRFRKRGDALEVLGVTASEGGFAKAERPAPAVLAGTVRERLATSGELLPDEYESEICEAHGPWIATLAELLDTGLVLLVDYGFPRHEFYHPDRYMGTLMCHYRHRAHSDPFLWPGLQDITAHVEFTTVAEAAQASGLQVAGFTSQAQFLVNTGLLDDLPDPAEDAAARLAETNAINRLTSPAEMGDLFKVLALTRGLPSGLAGFARGDQRQRL